MPPRIDDRMQECVDRCQNSQESCLESLSHCLELGGQHADPDHIRVLMACADICDTSARFMLMGSRFHGRTCEVCAEVCEACAADCASHEDDELLQRTADMCRRCAESCRQMATAAAARV